MCIASERLRAAKDKFHADLTKVKRMSVEERKKELGVAYTKASERSLTKKIVKIESAADKCKCQESFMFINEITGRKRGNIRSKEHGLRIARGNG